MYACMCACVHACMHVHTHIGALVHLHSCYYKARSARRDCHEWPEWWTENRDDFNPYDQNCCCETVAKPFELELLRRYNHFVGHVLENASMPGENLFRVLPIWYPTALLGNRGHNRRGDCTHYFGPGAAHWLWSTMLLNVIAQDKPQLRCHTEVTSTMQWQGLTAILDDPNFYRESMTEWKHEIIAARKNGVKLFWKQSY